ncbi:MAG: hypothetical protein DDT32_02229 [Syntrophomonadaceae bacterium]|nr:hypothetical protein [Bacillota bacterium]MBT9148455.1 hypothetical protein [Bacillota bacterium]
MAGKWEEVVRLTFKGQRFKDHALDLSALSELAQFQRLVAETAKSLWRATHPGRERLPKQFENRIRLCLRKIEEGSAVAPLEVYTEDPVQIPFEPTEVEQAISLARDVFAAVEEDQPIPERFPKELLQEFVRWGAELADDEEIEVKPFGSEPTRFTPRTREKLAKFMETSYEDQVDVTGEVLEADVRQRRFQLWVDDRTGVTIPFSKEEEDEVTTALKEHHSRRVRVKGQGEFSPQGKPLRIMQVSDLQVLPVGETPFDISARSIWEEIAEIAESIPREEWDKLPSDLTDNLDHYIYGSPK